MIAKPVIFQGTFDPFTSGHLAVVKTALELFGEVRILLLVNPDKTPLFSVTERKEIIETVTAELKEVSVDSCEGLLVDYMRARGLNTCVRGVRHSIDAAYEMQNHQLSSSLYPPLQTILISSPAALQQISSSQVKKDYQNGCLAANNVAPQVFTFLQKKFFR